MAEKKNQIVQATQTAVLTPVEQEERSYELMLKQAEILCHSTMIPDTYKGEANTGNVIIAMNMAKRMNTDPLMVMQNLNVIHGKPSFGSAFLIAAINATGRYTSLRYEFRNRKIQGQPDELGCRAYAYEKSDTERKDPLYGTWVTMTMAAQEGWLNKAGSKWKTMPEQMLRYRAAAFWQRTYAPEVSMGMHTTEEVIDMYDAPATKSAKQINIEAAMQRASAEAPFEVIEPLDEAETTEAENEPQSAN